MALTPAGIGAPRWDGKPHRLEVWYSTFTDSATGEGYWLHYETVAPVEGEPYAHGWAAIFPVDGPARAERFGPLPVAPPREGSRLWFSAGDARVDGSSMAGSAGDLSWDLQYGDDAAPLLTFPKWSWEREVLPASQVVPFPTATIVGTFRIDDRAVLLSGARGNLARIYSHGSAERWAWLHADLGDGDVLEIVAGAPRRRGPVSLPIVPLVQLRVDGRDWPRQQLALSRRQRACVALPDFSVATRSGRRRLRAEVHVPPECSVALRYTDPDGSTATCTNSERASAEIVVEQWDDGWRTERAWSLRSTAHAEVGLRP
jgi:hypothetical protein